MRPLLLLLLAAAASPAHAAPAEVSVCYNNGCISQAPVRLDAATLEAVRLQLAGADDAAAEREALAIAVGRLLAVAGTQSPVAADRAGNYLDLGVEGRMDCIDHSTSTTRMLRLLEARGWLRFHRVLEPERRSFLILQHFSAAVEEIEPPVRPPAQAAVPDYLPVMLAQCDCADAVADIPRPPLQPRPRAGERFVIDSWFVDNGEAAVVLPLADWLDGEGPNVQ